MGRVLTVEDVYEEIREADCWDHLREPGIVLVKGKGQTVGPMALVVVGAPGATENTKRRPLCGPSGRVLTGMMSLAGLYTEDDACLGACGSPHSQYDCPHRTDVRANAFLTNAIKYRLPGNRVPNSLEVQNARESLRQEWIALGRPKLIVAVGSVARLAVAPLNYDDRKTGPGDWIALSDGETYVWVQYHPSYGLQHPEARPLMEAQWERMGKTLREGGLL